MYLMLMFRNVILQVNSFQAIVVGNKAKNSIKVRYIYQDREMNWDLTLYENPINTEYPAGVGVMNQYGSDVKYAGSNLGLRVSTLH